jgi:hypothetical protein
LRISLNSRPNHLGSFVFTVCVSIAAMGLCWRGAESTEKGPAAFRRETSKRDLQGTPEEAAAQDSNCPMAMLKMWSKLLLVMATKLPMTILLGCPSCAFSSCDIKSY